MKNKLLDSQKIAMIFVIVCSIMGTLAQFSFKIASNNAIVNSWENIFINPFLIIGYLFYGISMILLTVALKMGELSSLYPFLALTFVWVVIFSPMIFKTDHFDLIRIFGVIFILLGISLIGFGSKNEN